MKSARTLAHDIQDRWLNTPDHGHYDLLVQLTQAIEQDRRETVEACERAIGKLPVVGIAVAPYIAALVAARHAVLSLSPKETT